MKFRDIIQNILEGEYMFHATGQDKNGRPLDVNKVEPYYSDSIIFMSGRDTGHFGSGMYFSSYSCKDWGAYIERVKDYQDNHKPDEKTLLQVEKYLYRVDADIYQNLYRVTNENQGRFLHKTLSFINSSVRGRGYSNEDFDRRMSYPRINHNLQLLGLKLPPYKEYIAMIKKAADDIANSWGDEENRNFDRRSLSTRIMEYNGYNGVNVSGVPELDNTTYGSVIYDLSKKDYLTKVTGNQVNIYCSMDHGIINKRHEYADGPEQRIMRMLSKDGPVNAFSVVHDVPEKYLAFFFNRYPYFLPSFAIEKLSENGKKIYFASLFRKLRKNEMKNYDKLEYELRPLFEYNIDAILNPNFLLEGKTLLHIVLLRNYEFNDNTQLVPLLKRIKETGKVLSPEEQELYDDIKEANKDYYWFDGAF